MGFLDQFLTLHLGTHERATILSYPGHERTVTQSETIDIIQTRSEAYQ